MYEKNDFFDYVRDYWRRFCFFLGSIATWISIFWKPVAIGMGILAVLGAIFIGVYELAVASPAVKLSMTLGTILAYNLISEHAKRNSHMKEGHSDKLGIVLGFFVLFLIAIAIYSLILSAFVVPWFLSALIFLGLGFAIVLVVLDEKKIAIPRQVFWLRNITTITSFIGLGYYLAKFQGWI